MKFIFTDRSVQTKNVDCSLLLGEQDKEPQTKDHLWHIYADYMQLIKIGSFWSLLIRIIYKCIIYKNTR